MTDVGALPVLEDSSEGPVYRAGVGTGGFRLRNPIFARELLTILRQPRGFALLAITLLVSTIATMAMLKIVQLLFTRRSFRRLLAEVVTDSGYELEKNQKVAVQIGELLGLPKGRDQSVPEYIQEVRKALGLKRSRPEPRAPTRPSRATSRTSRCWDSR